MSFVVVIKGLESDEQKDAIRDLLEKDLKMELGDHKYQEFLIIPFADRNLAMRAVQLIKDSGCDCTAQLIEEAGVIMRLTTVMMTDIENQTAKIEDQTAKIENLAADNAGKQERIDALQELRRGSSVYPSEVTIQDKFQILVVGAPGKGDGITRDMVLRNVAGPHGPRTLFLRFLYGPQPGSNVDYQLESALHNAHALFVLYDLTAAQRTLAVAGRWLSNVPAHKPIFLVGTKADAVERSYQLDLDRTLVRAPPGRLVFSVKVDSLRDVGTQELLKLVGEHLTNDFARTEAAFRRIRGDAQQ